MAKKAGRPSKQEREYINKAVAEGKTPESLAEELGRNLETILASLDNQEAIPVAAPLEDDEVVKKLTTGQEWRLLTGEFSFEELNYFKHRYRKLIQQFRGDVTATEETQVFLLIKFELLMNRNLKASKRSLQDIARLEKQIDKIYNKYTDFEDADDNERSTAMTLESQLLTSRTSHQTKSTEFVKLQEKHSAILKELKATRDQRMKNMQDQQHTFMGLLRQFQEEEWRDKAGREMELAGMAREKTYNKLGEHHKYVDGSLDRPILSADTVDKTE